MPTKLSPGKGTPLGKISNLVEELSEPGRDTPVILDDIDTAINEELEELSGLNIWIDQQYEQMKPKASWKTYALDLERIVLEIQATLEILSGETQI